MKNALSLHSTTERHLSQFPVSEGETLLEFGHCLLPNFVSSTSNAVHSNSRMRTKRSCSLLIGSPVLKACCTSPNCNLCPWLLTACTTVMKSSLVSVRRSGSVNPFMKSLALARARCCVLVRFPNTTPASVHRTIGPTCTTPWLLDSWAEFATPSPYSSGTRLSPQRSTSSF